MEPPDQLLPFVAGQSAGEALEVDQLFCAAWCECDSIDEWAVSDYTKRCAVTALRDLIAPLDCYPDGVYLPGIKISGAFDASSARHSSCAHAVRPATSNSAAIWDRSSNRYLVSLAA